VQRKVPLRWTAIHRVPHRLVHLEQRLVAEDAGVVDENVDAAEAIDRRLDDGRGGVGRGDRIVD